MSLANFYGPPDKSCHGVVPIVRICIHMRYIYILGKCYTRRFIRYLVNILTYSRNRNHSEILSPKVYLWLFKSGRSGEVGERVWDEDKGI